MTDAERPKASQRIADIVAGGLLAMLVAGAWDDSRRVTTEQALSDLEHLIDPETKQLVTAHLRRRAREIARALVTISEGTDNASHEATSALLELRQIAEEHK